MLRFGHWSDAEGGVERVAWVSFWSTEVLFFWLWCVCGYEHVLRGTQQEFVDGDCRADYLLKLSVDVCDLKVCRIRWDDEFDR